MSALLSRSIGTKVSDEDYEMLKAIAGDRKLADWLRDVALKAAMSDPTAAAQRTILEELLALRRVVVNLGFALATGQAITADQMRGLIEAADAEKYETARARLSAE
jgi:hypothetical protein